MADGEGIEGFRAEARAWLEENLPHSLRGDPDAIPEALLRGERLTGDADLRRRRMGDKGWGVPTWPRAYGGGGLKPAEAAVAAIRAIEDEIGAINEANAWGNANATGSAEIISKYTKIPVAAIESTKMRGQYQTAFDLATVQPLIDAAAKYGALKSAFPMSDMFAPGISYVK